MEQVTKITFSIISDRFPNLEKNLKEYEQHCVTYILHNWKQIYIGETSNLKRRFKDHQESKRKFNLIESKIITSEYFNKSAIYDVESKLINYIYAENNLEVLNIKTNQSPHNYFMKEKFNSEMFHSIWEKLKEENLVKKDIHQIENTHLFKYSPFKELSEDQIAIVKDIISLITKETDLKGIASDSSIVTKREFSNEKQRILISGGPGTGKTLLIIKIAHDLAKRYLVDTSKVAICIPQSNLLHTFKAMIKHSKLKIRILRPVDVSKLKNGELDLLIVDEAHRLKQHFSKQSKDLKHLNGGKFTELDLVLAKSKHLLLMYDSKQTVRPADVSAAHIQNIGRVKQFELHQQFRVKKGANYLRFVESLLQTNGQLPDVKDLGDYDFKVVDSLSALRKMILEKDKIHGLSRLASGYYKEWVSKKDPSAFDFNYPDVKLRWNSVITKWAHTENAVNEVGCIHTLQGEDLNYTGVIIGDEIYLDQQDGKIKIKKENYYDQNGTPIKGTDAENKELTNFIKNIYYVLLTRGMLGTYVYIKDENLRSYFQKSISSK